MGNVLCTFVDPCSGLSPCQIADIYGVTELREVCPLTRTYGKCHVVASENAAIVSALRIGLRHADGLGFSGDVTISI